jgi:hypothetical protein
MVRVTKGRPPLKKRDRALPLWRQPSLAAVSPGFPPGGRILFCVGGNALSSPANARCVSNRP